jgi:transcriptional regulator with GAF, ATPase, and Fis domain
MEPLLPEWQFIEFLKQAVNPETEIKQTCQRIVELALHISGSDIGFIYAPWETIIPTAEHSAPEHLFVVSSNSPAGPMLTKEMSISLKSWMEQALPTTTMVFDKASHNLFPMHLSWFGEHFDTLLVVPLGISHSIRGILGLCHQKTHHYPEIERNMVKTAAYFGEMAISYALAVTSARRKAFQIENLFQISQLLVSGGYFEEILTFVAQTVLQIMNIQVCSIILANEERQLFYFKAVACPDKSYHQLINASISNFACGNSYFSRQPTCIPNLKLEKKFADPDLVKKYNLHSMLSVPMTCLNKIIGVFNVYTTEFYTFTEQEIHLLQLIANQVASVVHETYLTKEIRKTKRDLLAQKKLQRAKSILMKKYQLSEDDAHRLILRRSMDLRKPILEIADNIIHGLEVQPH